MIREYAFVKREISKSRRAYDMNEARYIYYWQSRDPGLNWGRIICHMIREAGLGSGKQAPYDMAGCRDVSDKYIILTRVRECMFYNRMIRKAGLQSGKHQPYDTAGCGFGGYNMVGRVEMAPYHTSYDTQIALGKRKTRTV